MGLLNNDLLTKYLTEAPGDEPETGQDLASREQQSERQTMNTETSDENDTDNLEQDEDPSEEVSEEEETSEEDQTEEDIGEESGEEDFSSDSEEEDSDSDEEEDEPSEAMLGNPHAKYIYFSRFKNLRNIIRDFTDVLDRNLETAQRDLSDKEKRNIKRIREELSRTMEQIDYLLIQDGISKLELEAVHKIYAAMKTKISTVLNMFAKVFKIDI